MYSTVGSGDRDSAGQKAKTATTLFTLLKSTLPYVWTKNTLFVKLTFLVSLVFLVLGALGDLVVPLTLKYAVDELAGDEPKFPLVPIILYGIASFAATACTQLRDINFAYVSANTERLVALETFEHLQSLSLSFHLTRETGSVLRSVSRGASSFAGLMRVFLFQLTPIFFQVFVVCIFLFVRYKWYFGVVTAAVIILYIAFTFTTTNWRDRFRRIMNQYDNEFNQKATDALLNFETVKYFGAEQHEETRYDTALQAYSHANTRSQQTLAVLNSGQQLIIVTGVVCVMVLAARLVTQHALVIGDFVLLFQFILTLYQPLGFLGMYYRMIKSSMIDVENMLELWQEKPDITDVPNAPDLVLRQAAPAIEFRNVSFAYRNGVPILRDVSFTVGAGEQVAIVGASGAGKSTLARLLYRFYECSSGRILMDGTDIASVRQQSLRRVIAIVPQDTVLFNDTLSYNIQYGAFALEPQGPSASVVADAVRWAQLDAFVARQPKGLETKVGERGLRLSGGEKQRVAIARAILKRPAVLLFDEATSSLDSHTEAHIQSAIAAVAAGRTTITIAHRLSTIAHSHKIIVLDKGQVAEQGTHEELINQKGLYFQMWNRQQKTNELQADLSKLAAEEAAEAARQAAQSSPPAASGSVSPRALADFLGGEARHAVHAQGHMHNHRAPASGDGGGQAHGLRDALLSPPTASAASAARPAAESATASIILHINDEEPPQAALSATGLSASAAALHVQRASSSSPPSVAALSNAVASRASANRSPSSS